MTSLAVLAWMSVVSAVLWSAGRGGPGLGLIHLALQASVTAAILIEAGSAESGRPSRLRRPSQGLALAMFVTLLVSLHGRELGFLSSLFHP